MTKEQKRYSTFESELTVRPDDIDMNNHVHNSKYLDYVLAARYDQMGRCFHIVGLSSNFPGRTFRKGIVLSDAARSLY